MITFLRGKLVESVPTQITVEVGGVGYELLIPLSSFDKLPARGGDILILTHLSIREDAHVLYGFMSAAERDMFRLLIHAVSGIGSFWMHRAMALMRMDRTAESFPSLDRVLALARKIRQ